MMGSASSSPIAEEGPKRGNSISLPHGSGTELGGSSRLGFGTGCLFSASTCARSLRVWASGICAVHMLGASGLLTATASELVTGIDELAVSVLAGSCGSNLSLSEG